jgi:hypothetical protein
VSMLWMCSQDGAMGDPLRHARKRARAHTHTHTHIHTHTRTRARACTHTLTRNNFLALTLHVLRTVPLPYVETLSVFSTQHHNKQHQCVHSCSSLGSTPWTISL